MLLSSNVALIGENSTKPGSSYYALIKAILSLLKSAQDTNATKHDEDDTTSRGSAGGRSQGARKRKAIAEANAENAKVEKERDELREALNLLKAQLGTGTRLRTVHVPHV